MAPRRKPPRSRRFSPGEREPPREALEPGSPKLLTLELHPDAFLDDDALREAIARNAHLGAAPFAWRVLRRSIDARRARVRIRAELEIWPGGEAPSLPAPASLELPALSGAIEVAIVGAGPAGMFCAWQLARHGIRARIFERGKAIRERRRDLAALSQRGQLNPESNYCFGEGGAGTFSDGKLYTRSDKRGPVREVLEALVAYGAPSQILVDARPHIGTNKLPRVITAMREHLAGAGVDIAFDRRVDGLDLTAAGTAVSGVRLAGGEHIEVPAVVVAPGHSAHDVLDWLRLAGAAVELKPFAIGVRIEHSQDAIDRMQYGELAGHPALGAASYRLVEQVPSGAAWSFCMCPGGYIVCAASQPRRQVVNGMSPSQRRGRFANSGFVAPVGPEQLAAVGLDPSDPFAGLAYQAQLEHRAYDVGGGGFVAPAQTLADFVADRPSRALPETSYHRGVIPSRLDDVLGQLAAPLREALQRLDHKMPGFAGEHAIAVGLESRTSCPVRVLRGREDFMSPSLAGLFPCGEGAGYAGGIVSAALDGMAVADAVARRVGKTALPIGRVAESDA
ncbi:MAG: NAD(P)/FAD-dependent oxidoreductase [Myxococcales bacterium]|nr:NAD(P)/FAD-dependent oxidoreductase [Myxococcales bacterium]